MLGHIKPKQFLFVFNPQLGKDPGDPDAHQRPHHGDGDCDQDADDLCGKEDVYKRQIAGWIRSLSTRRCKR